MEELVTITDTIIKVAADTIPQIAMDTASESATESVTSVAIITKITYLLFLFLILAIFVERTTEIFMSIVKYLDIKRGWYKFWNRQAEKFKVRLDRLYGFQGSDTEDKKLLYRWILWNIISEKPYTGGKDIIATKSVRTQYYRIISRIFALVLSLLFSIWVYRFLKIDLVTILNKVSETILIGKLAPWVKIVLTAAILTAGSEPLHQLIKRFEKVGKSKKS
ncbi:MAG: hypothetical protein KAT68_05795 [Bacteroidales bacterium]|nr:hypothetical protein [Bacteroidales bacterium]